MKDEIVVKNGIVIPGHEIEITFSRAGGPGGQHVNTTNTRVSVRWNVENTSALNALQKMRVMKNLKADLTSEGDIIIHHGSSRSQAQNKQMALTILAEKIRKALYVQKKRKPTKIPQAVKKARLESKSKRGQLKKMRRKKITDES